jgi:cytochrome c553
MIRKTALALLTASITLSFQVSASDASAKADPEKGKALAALCVGCHGADGNSFAPSFPHLAGQGGPYIQKQLTQFKNGQRNNPIMLGMAAAVADEDMKHLGAWFSSQKIAKPATVQQEPEMAALGKKIWTAGIFAKGVPACAGCHGTNGAGLPAQYPRLAGQFADYTATQLKAFRAEERTNDPEKMMRMIAAKLSDKEIQAVAEYATNLAR